MPRGKYVNHKGRGRSFTSAEELARENKDIQEKKWRKKKAADAGEESTDSESEEAMAAKAAAAASVLKEGDKESDSGSGSSDDDTDSEDDENRKAKGVEGLLSGMIENPNRRVVKVKKISRLDEAVGSTTNKPAAAAAASSSSNSGGGGETEKQHQDKPELSRREREAIEKVKAKAHYQKLHAEGKTEEARKDLARLAIIRKQREDAALKRVADQQSKDAVKQTKQTEIGKALGKK